MRSITKAFAAMALGLAVSGCWAPVMEGAHEGLDAAKRPHFQKKAETGDAQAQYALGMTYCCEFGPQFERDVQVYDNQKATEWLCKSARQDYGDAQLQLAKMYAGKTIRGLSPVKRASALMGDHRTAPEVAWVYASLAVNNDIDGAAKLRDSLAKKLKDTELSQAQHDLDDWQNAPCLWKDVIPPEADKSQQQQQQQPAPTANDPGS